MSEVEVLDSKGLKEFTKPKQSGGSESNSVLKVMQEANKFLGGIQTLFQMGEKYSNAKDGDTPSGNAGAKYEKGLEQGLQSAKGNLDVSVTIDTDGAMAKIEGYVNNLMDMVDDDETAKDLKEKVKEQLNGEDKDLIKGMVHDFIRSHVTAKIV